MSRDPLPSLLVALGVAALLVQVVPTAPGTVDDAWITARVADQVLAGNGPVFVAGERVEAFSDPAWLLLLVAGGAAGLAPLTVMLAGGVAGGIATVLLSAVLTARLAGAFDRRAGVAALLVGLSPHLAVSSTIGLESTLWSAGVTAATIAVVTGRGALAIGLLPWIRPEGTLLAPLLAGIGAARAERPLWWAAPAVVPWLALHGVRAAWFGTVFANPVTAKAYVPPLSALLANVDWVLRDGPAWPAALGAAALAVAAPPRRWERALPLAVALFLAGAFTRAMEWMPGDRILLPLWVAAAVAVATSELAWLRAAALAGALALPLTPFAARIRSYDDHNTLLPGTPSIAGARWLRERLPPGSTVAIRDAGAFAWALGPGIDIRETYPHPLTRRTLELGGPLPDLLVTTVRREDARATDYPQDQALLRRARWRHLGRLQQHFHRYYDVWAPPGSRLAPLPPSLLTPVDPPLRAREAASAE